MRVELAGGKTFYLTWSGLEPDVYLYPIEDGSRCDSPVNRGPNALSVLLVEIASAGGEATITPVPIEAVPV